MTKESLEKKEFFEALLEEACLFVKFYLGDGARVNEVFEEALGNLSCMDDQEYDLHRAKLFLELQKVCRATKFSGEANSTDQLELFTELTVKSGDFRKDEKEIGIYRALAYLICLANSSSFPQNDSTSDLDEQLFVPILEFSQKLLQEKYLVEEKSFKEEDYTRQEKILRYLMGLLPDDSSLEVEKKCRQYSTWQRNKVWSTKIIAWYKEAQKRLNEQGAKTIVEYSSEIKVLFGQKFLQTNEVIPLKIDRNRLEPGEKKSESSNLITEKDLSLKIFCLVGLFALLVGYFGWDEHQSKNFVPVIHQGNLINQPIQTPDNVEFDELTNLAAQRANQVATEILGMKTLLTVTEMEKQIKVPSPLLEVFEEVGSERPVLLNLDSIHEKRSEDNVTSGAKEIENFLSLKTAYLFKPDEESLGKIIDLHRIGGQIFFKRADWPNPGASFGLPVSDYEIRLGSKKSGFLILSGNVRRALQISKNNSSIPSYSMSLARAWWLGEDQARREVNLDFLGTPKGKDEIVQGQKHLKNR